MLNNLNEIKDAIENLIIMQDKVLLYIEEEINYFINNQIKDDIKAEQLFEQLLNLFQTDKVLELYKKLGRYYYYINQELVIDYCNLYQELYLDDEKIKIIK